MSSDKMDTHYHQQLSALMDGDLPADRARFLLRRLEHDGELAGCWDRWQLAGDALRGQAQAPAPAGFAERVAAAIAVQPDQASAGPGPSPKLSRLGLWGGGALAASVALVALLVVRQQVPEQAPASAPMIASVPAAAVSPPAAPPVLPAAVAGTAMIASVPAPSATQRRSTTRGAPAGPRAPLAVREPASAAGAAAIDQLPVVHAIAGVDENAGPFSDVQISSAAPRPWPRAVLPQYPTANGALNTGFPAESQVQDFYPFQPRVPQTIPSPPPAAQQP